MTQSASTLTSRTGHVRVRIMTQKTAHAAGAAIKALLATAVQHYRMRQAIAELQGLDDRTLHDMGVRRDNIKSLVHTNLGRRAG